MKIQLYTKQALEHKLNYACSSVVLLGMSIEDALKEVNLPKTFYKDVESMLEQKGYVY